jgi:peptide/nickel transport system substrate-binding protein
LEEWVQNDHILLVKNPDYNWAPEWTGHDGPANVDRILVRYIPEDATRTVELEAGSVHILLDPPPPQELARFRDNPDYVYMENPQGGMIYVGMNVLEPLISDLRTRKAIGHAIDRELISETLYQGLVRPDVTTLPDELGGDEGVAKVSPHFDIEMARELLAEVGWEMGPDGVLVADGVEGIEDGTPFEASLITYQQDEFRRLSEVVQNMLSEVGIEVNVQLMDAATYDDQLRAGEFQLIIQHYHWDNNDNIEYFFHGKMRPYPNYIGVEDEALDEMLDIANYQTPTWEERDTRYAELHKYLMEEWYPWAPIFQPASVIITRSSVMNFEPIPLRITKSVAPWVNVYLEGE